jgi:hypothetical protein
MRSHARIPARRNACTSALVRSRVGFALAVAACLVSAPAVGQVVRVTGLSTAQYVQVRPLVNDSVPVGETTGDGLIRRTADGHLVRCVTGETICRGVKSGDISSVVPVIQDLTVSAWGLGRGVRVYAQLRTRAAVVGNEELWPLADQNIQAMAAFLELDRGRVRLRGGRQWKVSGLGYYNFDGASALFRALPALSVEAFGGWSLARGLNEPLTSESLAAIEPFAPDKRSLLIGAQASYRPSSRLAASLLYQREIRTDRLGITAERVAADALWRWRRGTITGSVEADVVTRDVNDGRLDARMLVTDALTTRAWVRTYKPFFELWTIWGVFDPVGFGEGGVGLSVSPAGRSFSADFDFSRRKYRETNASSVFGTYRSSGWTATANASWVPAAHWNVQGNYRVEFGFGSAGSDAGIRAQREFGSGTSLGISALAFQRQYEFRVSEGTVYGLGADGRIRLATRTRLNGSLAFYRQSGPASEADVDWSQVRGLVQFEWTIGPEPGTTGGAR